jgi:hypothetical protein
VVFVSLVGLVWFGCFDVLGGTRHAGGGHGRDKKGSFIHDLGGGMVRRGLLAWGHGNFIGGKTATDWNLTQKMEKRETCAKIVGNLSRLSFFFQGNYYAISADVAGIPGNFPIPPRP